MDKPSPPILRMPFLPEPETTAAPMTYIPEPKFPRLHKGHSTPPPVNDSCHPWGILAFVSGLFMGWASLGIAAWAVIASNNQQIASLEARVRAERTENRELRASLREPVVMPGEVVGEPGEGLKVK